VQAKNAKLLMSAQCSVLIFQNNIEAGIFIAFNGSKILSKNQNVAIYTHSFVHILTYIMFFCVNDH
jgi:hypothetical protein